MSFFRSHNRREEYTKVFISEIPGDYDHADFQRLIDHDHVTEIYHELKTTLDQNRIPIIPSVVIECTTPYRKYILDGQHRTEAYRRLAKDGYDFEIVVNKITVDTEQQAEMLFRLVNRSKPVPEMPRGISLGTINPVVKYFVDRYPNFFLNKMGLSGVPKRPKMYLKKFAEHLGYVYSKKNIPVEDMIKKIEKFNKELKGSPNSRFKVLASDYPQRISKLLETCARRGGLYIGMFRDYEWITEVFDVELPYRKKKIPKHLKTKVWDNTFGDEARKGECVLCKKQILFEDFDCGHIVAEKNGGKMILENLVPMCRGCNVAVGTDDVSLRRP